MNAGHLWANYLAEVVFVVIVLVALALLAHLAAQDLLRDDATDTRPRRAWWQVQSHQFTALARALRNALAMLGLASFALGLLLLRTYGT